MPSSRKQITKIKGKGMIAGKQGQQSCLFSRNFCVVCYTVFHVFFLNLDSVVFHTDFCFASFLLFSKVYCQWFLLAYKSINNTTYHAAVGSYRFSFLCLYAFIAFFYSNSIQTTVKLVSLNLTLKRACILHVQISPRTTELSLTLIIICRMRNLCNEFFYVFQVFRFFYLCLTQKDNDLSTNTYESLSDWRKLQFWWCIA